MAGNAYGRVIGIIAGSLGAIGALLSIGGAYPWWSLARLRPVRVRRPRHRRLRPGRAGGRGMTTHDADLDVLGPVDYLVVEFPADKADFSGEMARELTSLIERGLVRVLDLVDAAQGPRGVRVRRRAARAR